MLNLKSTYLWLSLGMVISTTAEVQAHSMRINSLDQFYQYYGNGFTTEQRTIINTLFTEIQPYMGTNGLQNAIADGYVPFTQEVKGHGTHWFNPQLINVSNIIADALVPAGLNFDHNNQLVAIFWAQEKYEPIVPLVQSLDLTTIDPATLPSLFAQYKQNTLQPQPTIFNSFGNQAFWHSHENVIIENLAAKNPSTGLFDPTLVNFRQSVTNENFIATLLGGLNNPDIVLAPFEQNQQLSYPYFNFGISPGFYMTHMWITFGNHDGLFAETHAEVSPNAIDEHDTFESGNGNHHGGGGHNHAVPEPFTVLGAGTAALFGSLFKRKLSQKSKSF